MPFGWVAAAGAIGSALIGSNASQSAADTQAAAANQSTALQQQMFNQTQQNVSPWLQAGQTSLKDLTSGLTSGAFNPASYTAGTPQTGVGAATNLQTAPNLGNLEIAPNVGQMQTVNPNNFVLQGYDKYTAENPYTPAAAWDASKFQQDPGYQFQLQQGLDALTNKSSLAGGMNSNNLKGLIGYAEGMANTDYQQAFQNYQTEAARGLNQYQTGLQDYIQQFLVGQNTNTLNNQTIQGNFNNQLTGTGFNNNVVQQQYQDAMQSAGFNNQEIQQRYNAALQGVNTNNAATQTMNTNALNTAAFNNQVNQQNFNNANFLTGANNQNRQQQFSNLQTLSQGGLSAGLQQGQIGANTAQSIGNTLMSGANARAAGTIGTGNAIAGGLSNAYNAYLQSQYMNPGGGYGSEAANNAYYAPAEGSSNFVGPSTGF